jgi:hypothetical protein
MKNSYIRISSTFNDQLLPSDRVPIDLLNAVYYNAVSFLLHNIVIDVATRFNKDKILEKEDVLSTAKKYSEDAVDFATDKNMFPFATVNIKPEQVALSAYDFARNYTIDFTTKNKIIDSPIAITDSIFSAWDLKYYMHDFKDDSAKVVYDGHFNNHTSVYVLSSLLSTFIKDGTVVTLKRIQENDHVLSFNIEKNKVSVKTQGEEVYK